MTKKLVGAAKSAAAKKAAEQQLGGGEGAENNSESHEATAGELAAIARADAAEAELAAIVAFIDSHDDHERDHGDTVAGAVERLVMSIQADLREMDAQVAAANDEINRLSLIGVEPEAEPAPSPERAAFEALEAGEVEGFALLPEAAALVLVFSDEDAVLPVPPVPVSREEITLSGGRAVYDRRLGFDAAAPSHGLTNVWLVARDPSVDDVPPAVRCAIPGGLRVGGGAQAAIPAGHLIF